MKSIALIVAALSLALASVLRADTVNVVTDGGADPTGVADSAVAFRNMVAHLETLGGGTIYVPAGDYRFNSVDDVFTANVVIKTPGIRIIGDAPSSTNLSATGVRIFQITGEDVFMLKDTSSGGGGSAATPDNTIFENLHISGTFRTGGATGAAIKFETNNTVGDGVFDRCVVRNVAITKMLRGISSSTATRGQAARSRVSSLLLSNVRCSLCSKDGVYLEEFSNLRVTDCEFNSNSDNGLKLLPFFAVTLGSRGGEVGTAFIKGSEFSDNKSSGLSCRGEITESSTNAIKDIHVTGCKMSRNSANGFTITQASNVEIATCTISENNGGSGNNIGACNGVSVIGCTFRANAAVGLQVAGFSSGITVASCSFVGNSASSAGTFAALSIANGASLQSYSNLTFTGSSTQKIGVLFSGLSGSSAYDPQQILLSGLNFEGGMNRILQYFGMNGTQKFRFDFLSPQNWTSGAPTGQPNSSPNGVLQYFEN